MENTAHTFKNLQVLADARNAVRGNLKTKYQETVQPFINVIEKVAAANNENHFEAMKRIQDDGGLINGEESKLLMFSAALMEIVEEKNLKI